MKKYRSFCRYKSKTESKNVDIYRLTMKTGSINFRQSAIQGVMQRLQEQGVMKVIAGFEEFKDQSNVIVANRMSDELKEVEDKVYTRDVFARD